MSQHRKNFLLAALDGSFLLGAVATGVFYAIVLSPGMQGTMLYNYTTEHLVEYVIVALWFWAVADVLRKGAAFPREALALRRPWLPERRGREPVANAPALLATLDEQPAWARQARVGRRLAKALRYVVDNGAVDYREELDSLARQEADRSHASYTLLRFVVRITPVLGFLGTVVHFGTALSGISFDKMSDQLPSVVGHMGQAFNVTTVALAAAMSIMFAQFVCEWIDRVIVHAIDRLVDRELTTRFEAKDASIAPFLNVVKAANDEALALIAGNIDRQTAAWSKAFDAVLDRVDKRQQLEAQAWAEALGALSDRHEGYDAVREERLRQMLLLIEERQDKFMAQIHEALEKTLGIRDDFAGMFETLHGIARGEGRLVELQASLAENLRVLHEARQIDDALHGLTGAIHLLTARHAPPNHKAAA
jgi:biopolymer transport protein ExbB/TolQ